MERRISESGEDLCAVCSETTKIYSIGECDHPICYKCATRMRVLCDQMYCAICRRHLPKIAFSKDFKKFTSLNLKQFKIHQKYSIFFECDTIRLAFFELQEHRCKICKDIKPFKSFATLRDHMKREHTHFPCDLCVKHLTIFTSERKFYDRKTLATHRRSGDKDDKSHKGHPLCKFCDERYLDNDELARHLRKDHFFCHFCDSDGISNQFYGDYSFLRDHFMEAHYLCEEGECANIQFTNAFRHELDHKAHVAAAHSRNFNRAMAKAARTLDVDIQLAPRSNANKFHRGANRGKGVVGPEDYNEVAAQQSSQGSYGRGRNLKYLRERREKEREEDQVARAITASLNSATQTSVSVVDGNLLRKEPEKPPPPPNPPTDYSANDFPDFSTGPQTQSKNNKNSDSDEDQKVSSATGDSMAKKVARSKGFNVQDGSMNDADFPSLGPGQSKSWLQPARGPVGWQKPEDFPDLGGAKPRVSQPPPTWTGTNKKQPPPMQAASRSSQGKSGSSKRKPGLNTATGAMNTDSPHVGSTNDFPSLNSISFALSKGMSSGTATDTLAKYASGGVNTSVQQSNVKVIEAKPEPNQTSSARTLQTSSRDFPTLQSKSHGKDFAKKSKDSGGQKVWGPKPVVEKPPEKPEAAEEKSGYLKMKKKSKNKNLGQYSQSSEDSSESLKNIGDQLVVKKESERTKPEVNKGLGNTTKPSTSEKNNVSSKKKSKPLKEDALLQDALGKVDSADNSDSGSLGSKGAGKKKSKQAKKSKIAKPPKTASPEPDTTKSVQPKEATKTTSVLKSTENLAKSEAAVTDITSDFPSIHNTDNSVGFVPVMSTSQTENHKPERSANSHQRPVNVTSEDDFPTLGGLSNPNSAPPPGFAKSKNAPISAAPPPGFSTATSTNKKNPPPGFTSKPPPTSDLAGIALLLSSNVAETPSQDKPQQVPVVEDTGKVAEKGGHTTTNGYSYVKPEDFSIRNQQLISDVVFLLEDDQDKFMIFKTLSSDFRKGHIMASDYYASCSEVIGEEKFNTIFTELLVLLPDILKQQNLLSVHRAKTSRSGVAKTGKKAKGWSIPKTQDFTVCSICEQVLLPQEALVHCSQHSGDSEFPMLGAS